MDATKFSIEKLNGKNYVCWAVQMQALLMAKDLPQYVDIEDSTKTKKGGTADKSEITLAKNQARVMRGRSTAITSAVTDRLVRA